MPARPRWVLFIVTALGFAIEIPLFLGFAFEWRYPIPVGAVLKLIHLPAMMAAGIVMRLFGSRFPSLDYPAIYVFQSCINSWILVSAVKAFLTRKRAVADQPGSTLNPRC
jgi:hypothetical protein